MKLTNVMGAFAVLAIVHMVRLGQKDTGSVSAEKAFWRRRVLEQ